MKKLSIFLVPMLCWSTTVFALTLQTPTVKVNGKNISPNKITENSRSKKVTGNKNAARLSEQSNRICYYTEAKRDVSDLILRTELFKMDNYDRLVLTIKNGSIKPMKIDSITFLSDKKTPDLRISGNTDGSVLVNDTQFFGIEHPMAKCKIDNENVEAWLPRDFELEPGVTWTFSAVLGTYKKGQLRRDFQTYLNAERAHPFRVLPHYNSWYDLNIGRNDRPWDKRMNEAEALETMRAFRSELSEKRNVFIESYLWDDGWDNWDSLWDFHKGFPNGFSKLSAEANLVNKQPKKRWFRADEPVRTASIGVWMSPCGGYGGSHGARVRYAKKQGIISEKEGLLRLSKKPYYVAFRDRCLFMIKKYNMNLFKFDRLGVGHDCNGANKEHAPDIQAILNLINEMRKAKPDVFINCTVGTWASPFWVMLADSIWRGGNDWEGLGPGSQRERWLTYRDNKVHDRFVVPAPLFPLNSMMVHGIIVGKFGPPAVMDRSNTPASSKSFANEVWMSMASGTGLQEYYISPKLMHKEWWDILATGINWLKVNEQILKDSHWVGGDPQKNKDLYEIYGYASLGEDKGIVILRNPSNKTQTISGSFNEWLEMPETEKVSESRVVYSTAESEISFPGKTDETVSFELEPFGVRLFEIEF